MNRQEKRQEMFDILTNAVKDVEKIQGWKEDILIRNFHKMLDVQKNRYKQHFNTKAAIKVKPLPVKVDRNKSVQNKEIPNRTIIADSSDKVIKEEVKRRGRLNAHDGAKIATLLSQGKGVEEIAKVLGLTEEAASRGVEKQNQ